MTDIKTKSCVFESCLALCRVYQKVSSVDIWEIVEFTSFNRATHFNLDFSVTKKKELEISDIKYQTFYYLH